MCKTDVHRYCEKFSNIFPFPVEEQNCHFEPKKICELQQKTRPKKAKKYSYTKDCKEQPREICDQCEKKSIQPGSLVVPIFGTLSRIRDICIICPDFKLSFNIHGVYDDHT